MALTLRILSEQEEALCLTLDGPRIVIGRAKSCDVQLLDPTVSARHAVIRLEGGSNVVVDEGSTNGTAVGRVRLPPKTPRVLVDGERIRIGRIWLEVGFGAGVASAVSEVSAVAIAHLRRQLVADGEDVTPRLEVLEGPDRGQGASLPEDGDLVVGRAQAAHLRLTDPLVSRRHVAACRAGSGVSVRELGSKSGARLGDGRLGEEPAPWTPGERLRLGETTLGLRDPVPEIAEEARETADVKMRPEDLEAPPPGGAEPVIEAPDENDEEPAEEPTPTPLPEAPPVQEELAPSGAWYATVDVLVALVALALLAVSSFGLVYVLG